MRLNKVPEDWNKGIEEPFLTKEFGEANKEEGEICYVKKGINKAIIVIKKKYISLFSRAIIFTNSKDEKFLLDIVESLKKKRIPYARIGNTMFGLNKPFQIEKSKIIERNTFILDLTKSEKDIWNGFNKKLRNVIRKSEKEGVSISEVQNEKELRDYYELSVETGKHIRGKKERKTFSVPPYSFFEILWKNKLGRFFIAKYGGEIIAGALFLVWKKKSVYFQSCLSRAYSSKQAPSLIQWEAIKRLKRDLIEEYDLGGITLGLDKKDSRFFVYEFKRKFNGKLKEFYNIEIELSSLKKLQDKIIKIIYGKND